MMTFVPGAPLKVTTPGVPHNLLKKHYQDSSMTKPMLKSQCLDAVGSEIGFCLKLDSHKSEKAYSKARPYLHAIADASHQVSQ